MSPYEIASLAVARSQLHSYVAADIIAALALGAAITGGVFAYRNIKILRLSALLSVEQDLTRRRAQFQSLALTPEDDPTDLQRAQFEEAKESYFNGLDRLAWAVLAGYFRDANMKQDYHEQLTAVMLRVLTLFEVPLVALFEVGSQFRFRNGVERVGTGNRDVAGVSRDDQAVAAR